MEHTEITNRLKTFKGLILDADGVWFDGRESRVVMGGVASVMKTRDLRDAQGLSFLRGLGVRVVFATGEGEPLVSIVEKINNLPTVLSGAWQPVDLFTGELKKGGKVASLEAWLTKTNLTWDECVYVGDDRSDYEAIQKAGLKVCPGDAQRIITKLADLKLTKHGGAGALREFAELVLDARGVDEATLPTA